MDPSSAMLAGLTCGLAIAVQVGPVSLLLIEAAVAGGRRAGVAGGMGVATADFAFAGVAAATGGAAGAALASHAAVIRIAAAAVLAAIAVSGLVAMARGGAGDATPAAGGWAGRRARSQYARFLGITMANPLTIASFAAVAAALSLDGPLAAIAFVAGVGAASAGWHLVLGSAAGHAGRWMTPRVRRGLAIAGRVGVLALAAHLALSV